MKKSIIEKIKELSRGGKIYTASSGYSGGWKHAKDNTSDYIAICEKLGLQYSVGNDAPKGGLNGKFIKVRKFNAETAIKKYELAESYAQGLAVGRAEFLQLRKAILGVDPAISQSGNLYPRGAKPTPADYETGNIADFTPRLTSQGVIEVWCDGQWRKLSKGVN